MNRAAFAGIPATGRPTEATRVGRVSKQMTTSDPLVWIDCEMTGLDLHTSSGLLDDLESGLTMEEARETVLDYVTSLVPEARSAQLAGNSVGTDKAFLARDMPELIEHLHYRIVDVSSLKELAKRWYPRTFFHAPKKAGGHRALADILESIDELRYYRAVLFPDGEGPSSQECKEVAERVLSEPTTGHRLPPTPLK